MLLTLSMTAVTSEGRRHRAEESALQSAIDRWRSYVGRAPTVTLPELHYCQ